MVEDPPTPAVAPQQAPRAWTCPQCGTENNGLKFCGKCAERCPSTMHWACNRCNFSNPTTARVCGACGMIRGPMTALPPTSAGDVRGVRPYGYLQNFPPGHAGAAGAYQREDGGAMHQ